MDGIAHIIQLGFAHQLIGLLLKIASHAAQLLDTLRDTANGLRQIFWADDHHGDNRDDGDF